MLIPSAFPLSLWRTFITTSILLPDLCLKYSLEYQKRASLFQLLPWIPLFVITFLEGQPYSSCLYFQVSNLFPKEKSPHSPKGQISTVTSDICLPAQLTNFTLSSIFLTRISATLEFFATFSECMFSEEMMVLSLQSRLLGISPSVSPLWLHNMSEVCFSIRLPILVICRSSSLTV